MRFYPALLAAAALAVAVPAFAQDAAPAACTAPTPPAVPNGATATMDDMQTGKNAITAFIAASDAYQECEVKGVTAQREAAKAAKAKFDNKIAKAAQDRIGVNQKQKEQAGKAWSDARKAYLAAHPS
jgi:hypothetical protein